MKKMRVTRMPLGLAETNCYILVNKETKEAIIVDPADTEYKVFDKVEALKAKPVALLLTHGHFDHIMASNEIAEHYDIPLIALDKEEKMLNNIRLNMTRDFTKKHVGYIPKVTRYVTDNEELDYAGFHFRVLSTPGHSPGSCCYYFPDEDVLISGDTLFKESCGRTDFETSSPRDMKTSLARLFDEMPDETEVFPGHLEETTIIHEKRYNPYFSKKKGYFFWN